MSFVNIFFLSFLPENLIKILRESERYFKNIFLKVAFYPLGGFLPYRDERLLQRIKNLLLGKNRGINS
jgi:hypothetical protein